LRTQVGGNVMPSDTKTRKDARSQRVSDANGRRDQGHVEPAGHGWFSLSPVPHPQLRMPSGIPGNVIWWGGLTALAAFGVVDWPVAAVVAAGTWVAQQQTKQSQRAQNTRA
jgi:hypothetical protein